MMDAIPIVRRKNPNNRPNSVRQCNICGVTYKEIRVAYIELCDVTESRICICQDCALRLIYALQDKLDLNTMANVSELDMAKQIHIPAYIIHYIKTNRSVKAIIEYRKYMHDSYNKTLTIREAKEYIDGVKRYVDP